MAAYAKLLSCIVAILLSYYWFAYVKRGPVYESNKSLKGKTVLITGGNTGIGKATCLQLAKKGAKIVIASRNVKRSEAAKQEIIKETGNDQVFVKHLDLSDFQSVRMFAKKFVETEEYIDYLINNAGVFALPGKIKNGVNKVFAVNHFGPFLLTNLLLDMMKSQAKTRPVRIINLSSAAYVGGKITDEIFYFNATTSSEFFEVYASSKLANIYFTTELSTILRNHDITVYSVHPGSIQTELFEGDGFGWFTKQFLSVFGKLFFRDSFYGCQTTLYCALDDDVMKHDGEYFSNCAPTKLWDFAKNRTAETYLWKESLKLTELV